MNSLITISLISLCQATLVRRIVGGYVTRSKPWMTYLSHPRSSCGGTQYTESLVITAAHCDKYEKEDWKAYPGIDNIIPILKGMNVKGYDVLERIKYPHYDASTSLFDLSLWWIDGPSSKRTIVDLDDGNEIESKHAFTHTIGWGLTKFYSNSEMHRIPYEDNRSDSLMKIHVNILGRQVCCKVFQCAAISLPVFCIGAKDKGQGFSFGDSGGPIYRKKNGRVILLGVISQDIDRPDHVFYGLNIKVSNVFYKDFINHYVDLFTPSNKGRKHIVRYQKTFVERLPSPTTMKRITAQEEGHILKHIISH